VIAHNLARWTSRTGAGEGLITTDTFRRRYLAVPGRMTHSARRHTLHPARWPWRQHFQAALAHHRRQHSPEPSTNSARCHCSPDGPRRGPARPQTITTR
jgi:hypothetical protein